MIVPIVLGFYFVVCISVVLFNCWKVLSGIAVQRRFRRRQLHYRAWFWCEAVSWQELTPEKRKKRVRKMARALRSNGRLMAFHAAMNTAEETSPRVFADTMPLLAEIVQGVFPYYARKTPTRQAYYSWLVTRFQVMRWAPSELLTAFLLEQIRTEKSLYNLENALRAVYSSGRVPLVLEALQALNSTAEIHIHEKLLVEGLLTFTDRDALIAALWERFPGYGVKMRELLLDYIRFASGAWGGQMRELLSSTDELETQIACLRYFGKYPSEEVRPLVYQLTRRSVDSQWELCAVCMTVLASYPGEQTLALLKQGLRSRNWYVRYNAALSLRELKVGAELVQDILTGDDRYAREMLQYRLELGDRAEPEEEAVPV